MYKAYKFRLYPSVKQIELLSKTFWCTRFVYNYFLDKCKKEKYTSAFNMIKELKDFFKRKVIIPILKVDLVNKAIRQIV